MFLLEGVNYNKVIEPLTKLTINHLFAMVVARRIVPGKVFVDNLKTPTTFYIVHPYGMSLLFGSTENAQFNEALFDYLTNRKNIRDKVEWLQVFPDAWARKIDLMLGKHLIRKKPTSIMTAAVNNDEPGNVIENTRVNFAFNPKKYEQFKKRLVADNSYRIVPFDERLYPKESSVILKYFWNDAGDFSRNWIGFSLLCDGHGTEAAACTAFSSFIVDKMLEIGIETNLKFRGKGYESIISSYLIDYCIRYGFEPIWSCRLENTASYKTAQKLGFEPVKYLPYYKLNGSPRKVTELKPKSSLADSVNGLTTRAMDTTQGLRSSSSGSLTFPSIFSLTSIGSAVTSMSALSSFSSSQEKDELPKLTST